MKIRKVLVVEDEVVDAIVLNRMLHRLGCQPVVVANGQQGVELFRREPFDVVLIDLEMPRMNGYQAARRIRSIERSSLSRVPMIALTTASEEGVVEACLAAGMDGFLAKPVLLDQLHGGLSRVAQQRGPCRILHTKLAE